MFILSIKVYYIAHNKKKDIPLIKEKDNESENLNRIVWLRYIEYEFR